MESEWDRLERLLHQWRRGEVADTEFAKAFANHLGALYLFFFYRRGVLGAEELATTCVSQAVLAVLKGRFGHQGPGSFKAWAYRIARCKLCDELIRLGRLPTSPLPEDLAWPHDDEEETELGAAVFAAVGDLEQPDRVILIRHNLEGRSFKEIGLELEMTEGTTRVRHHRILARLRESLPNHPAIAEWLARHAHDPGQEGEDPSPPPTP